jgi:glycine dehydrogenase subunit 2
MSTFANAVSDSSNLITLPLTATQQTPEEWQDEPLIFELSNDGAVGVDLPNVPPIKQRLGSMTRTSPLPLPNISEPQVVRHYTRLSQKNYSIDSGFYPLGSCTMKHNPRLNEKVARFSGFANVHPLQPLSTVQGALEVMDTLCHWLKTITGMPAIAFSPAAGAHGELCGMMAIKAALEARGDHRSIVLVPESAHGTNPATAAACGFTVKAIPARADGTVDVEAFTAALSADVAAAMITNPNTCGLFEPALKEIADKLHAIGAYLYCDGANFNAISGQVRPADLGIDAMHINLHKTYSTPHGGGGPGSGPVALSAALASFAPLPHIVLENGQYTLQENDAPLGRIKAFHGQFGTFIRALSYMMSMGSDGLKQASTDAVLNANYIRKNLENDLTLSFDGICMHEVLADERFLKNTGITTLDFAKAMIDKGFHPMTMYFPLVVQGAMLIEPTETESKQTLDAFIIAMKELVAEAKAGNAALFKNAPQTAPRTRSDETAAARKPVLRWESSSQ